VIGIILTMLMTALMTMFVHALTDRGELRRRVNNVEREGNLREGEVKALREALETRTDALQREVAQRTEAMQREIVAVCDRLDQKFVSLERMIDTLIRVLQNNGVGMFPRMNESTEG
jgi:hypothetical protein